MSRSPWWRRPAVALVLDVLLVLVFAAVGRASHDESGPVLGALVTAWPFLVGTAVGWLVVRVVRRVWPIDVAPGVTVWFATVLVGMLLRHAVGSGTAAELRRGGLGRARRSSCWAGAPLGAYAVRRARAPPPSTRATPRLATPAPLSTVERPRVAAPRPVERPRMAASAPSRGHVWPGDRATRHTHCLRGTGPCWPSRSSGRARCRPCP